eukprot:m.414898 g.414898  ORF g.414898 m.414898 type:complete len:153 (-) comp29463_c0_seq1:219-677(-)
MFEHMESFDPPVQLAEVWEPGMKKLGYDSEHIFCLTEARERSLKSEDVNDVKPKARVDLVKRADMLLGVHDWAINTDLGICIHRDNYANVGVEFEDLTADKVRTAAEEADRQEEEEDRQEAADNGEPLSDDEVGEAAMQEQYQRDNQIGNYG